MLEQADKNKNTHFNFETYDTYQWYLESGTAGEYQRQVSARTIPFWNSIVEHPDYDEFWRKEALGQPAAQFDRAESERGWILGSGRPVGTVADFPPCRGEAIPITTISSSLDPGFMENGRAPKGDSIGLIPFGGHETAQGVPREYRGAVLPLLPSRRRATNCTGRRRRSRAGRTPGTPTRPGRRESSRRRTSICTSTERSPSTPRRESERPNRIGEYVSDPANPVPYRQRPISPTYPAGDWRTWEVADQRFVDHRPDVLTFVSAPLDHDLTITGPVAAELFASTSGTDSDFVVKLIDVYPENAQKNAWDANAGPKPGQYAQSLNGYELPIAMEVRRGTVSGSYEQPAALIAGTAGGVEDFRCATAIMFF